MSAVEARPSSRAQHAASFASGLLFALGLALAGMTEPRKVIGFLDVFGRWDPSLMFVMVGGIAVNAAVWLLIKKRPTPVLSAKWLVPTRRDLDARLIVGSALFGLGWGLGGFCPGPGIVSLASGSMGPWVFVLAMLLGMRGVAAWEWSEAARQAGATVTASPSSRPGGA
ncbi:MAG: YeeE/YedE family protein [Myxococcales bacterium]|nr:YeeE/YedE family protein [Myxococcales bacterium]